jgi:hypothetical protein
MRTLSSYKTQIGRSIREKTGGIVEGDDIMESLNRGIRALQTKYGVASTKSRATFPVFSSVIEYPVESDFHHFEKLLKNGKAVEVDYLDASVFHDRSNTNDMAVDNVLEDRFLLFRGQGAGSVVLNTCDTYDGNGTWAVTGDAENIGTDEVNYETGSGSISFDVDVSDSGSDYAGITTSDMDAVDLTDYLNKGKVFLRVRLPSATYVSSVLVRWGSDSSNYYENSATTPYHGGAWRSGWNRVGINWFGATTTGTPDYENIDYMEVRVVYSASQTDMQGVNIDDVRFELGAGHDMHYYSTSMVKTSANAYQQTFTADADSTLFTEEDDDVLYFYAMSDSQLVLERYEESKLMASEFEKAALRMQMQHGSGRRRPTRQYRK